MLTDIILIGKVEHRFNLRGELQYLLLPDGDGPAQRSTGKGESGAALRLGLGGEQVGETFGFGKIDPLILERTAGKLAGLRLP